MSGAVHPPDVRSPAPKTPNKKPLIDFSEFNVFDDAAGRRFRAVRACAAFEARVEVAARHYKLESTCGIDVSQRHSPAALSSFRQVGPSPDAHGETALSDRGGRDRVQEDRSPKMTHHAPQGPTYQHSRDEGPRTKDEGPRTKDLPQAAPERTPLRTTRRAEQDEFEQRKEVVRAQLARPELSDPALMRSPAGFVVVEDFAEEELAAPVLTVVDFEHAYPEAAGSASSKVRDAALGPGGGKVGVEPGHVPLFEGGEFGGPSDARMLFHTARYHRETFAEMKARRAAETAAESAEREGGLDFGDEGAGAGAGAGRSAAVSLGGFSGTGAYVDVPVPWKNLPLRTDADRDAMMRHIYSTLVVGSSEAALSPGEASPGSRRSLRSTR
eukprot:gene365-54_t